MPLAYHLLRKFTGGEQTGYLYQELESAALVGLWRAAQAYQPGRAEFSTLAGVAILRRMQNVVRGDARYRTRVETTLDSPVPDKDGEPVSRMHLIPAKMNVDDDLAYREAVAAIKAVLAGANDKQRQIVRLWAQGYKQPQIATVIGVRQTYVSQVMRKFRKLVHEMTD